MRYTNVLLLFCIIITPYTIIVAQKKGFLTDNRNEEVYATIYIRGKTWMAEDLRLDNEQSFIYDNRTKNEVPSQGRLYIYPPSCPEGWHLPSQAEWEELVRYYGTIQKAYKKLQKPSQLNLQLGGTVCLVCDRIPYFALWQQEGVYWTSDHPNDNEYVFMHLIRQYESPVELFYSNCATPCTVQHYPTPIHEGIYFKATPIYQYGAACRCVKD